MAVDSALNYYRNILGILLIPIILAPILVLLKGEIGYITFIYFLMAFYWFMKVLPHPIIGLIPLVLLPFFKISNAENTALLYLKEPNMLYLGGFILSTAVKKSKLHDRIGLCIIFISRGSPRLIHAFIMLVSFLLSLLMSPIITILIMCPIVESVIKILELNGIGNYYANKHVANELINTKSLMHTTSIISLNIQQQSDQLITIHRSNFDSNINTIPHFSNLPNIDRRQSSHESSLPEEKVIVLDDDEVNRLISRVHGRENSYKYITTSEPKRVTLLDFRKNDDDKSHSHDDDKSHSHDEESSIQSKSYINVEEIEDMLKDPYKLDKKHISNASSVHSLPSKLFNLEDELEKDKQTEFSDSSLNDKTHQIRGSHSQLRFSRRFSKTVSNTGINLRKVSTIMALSSGYEAPSKITICFFIGAAYACTLGGYCNIIIPHDTNKKVKNILELDFKNSHISLSQARWCILFYPMTLLILILIYFWLEILFLGLFRSKSEYSEFMNFYQRSKIKENIRNEITFKEGAVIAALIISCCLLVFYNPLNLPGWGFFVNYEVHHSTIVFVVVIIFFTLPSSSSFMESFKYNNLHKLRLKQTNFGIITWSDVHNTVYIGFIFAYGGMLTIFSMIEKEKIIELIFTKLHKELPDIKVIHMIVTFLTSSILGELLPAENVHLIKTVIKLNTLLSVDKNWNPLVLAFIAENSLSHKFCTTIGSIPNFIIGFWCSVSYIHIFVAGLGAHFISGTIFFLFSCLLNNVLFDVNSFPNWANRIKMENLTQPGVYF